jgi:23S rRNA (pseudouridine1915-N3)-methyltransferase
MIKIKVLTIGKTKESWLLSALKTYEKRLTSTVFFSWDLVKDDQQLLSHCEEDSFLICLDPKGAFLTSEEFAKKFFFSPQSKITFIIGGDKGLAQNILEKASFILSLSPMTFTHQMTRIILIEQIYRALEIAKGSKYHK